MRSARKQLLLTQPQLVLAAGAGVRFIVELEAGKPTFRLENVLRVVKAPGGEIALSGLPQQRANSQGKCDQLDAWLASMAVRAASGNAGHRCANHCRHRSALHTDDLAAHRARPRGWSG